MARNAVRSGAKAERRPRPAFVRGFLPKSLPQFIVFNEGDFPFRRNPSLCLQAVLDDAYAELHHSALEDLFEGILGIFSLGPRGRGGPSKLAVAQGSRNG